MANIQLMTDSACDIPKHLEEQYQIDILSFPIMVGDQSFYERIDFTSEEFYEILMREEKTPTTAQITAMQLKEKYQEYFDKGVEALIYITINSKGSATHQNALMARESFFKSNPQAVGQFDIYVVDSKTYTMAYGYAVVEAAKKMDRGSTAPEIVAYLEDWFDSVEIYFAPFTLEFVKKSGRISVAAAFVGELLGLRPIISFIDGDPKIVTKVRGDKAIAGALLSLANQQMVPKTPYFTLSGCLEQEGVDFHIAAEKQMGYSAVGNFKVGAAISINAGPKLVGIVVKGKRRNPS